jgi:hypothetical protein
MERLLNQSDEYLHMADGHFNRFLFETITGSGRIDGIIGESGSGKTGLLIKLMKARMEEGQKVLYLDLGDVCFTAIRLFDIGRDFYQKGGEFLFLDNLQRYGDAAAEIVWLLRDLPDLRIVFACSFIQAEDEDWQELKELSFIHILPGMSYREYLEYKYKLEFPLIHFDELIELNRNPGVAVLNRIRPMQYFDEYLKKGYKPVESIYDGEYQGRIQSQINHIIEFDFSAAYKLDQSSSLKIRKLLMKIANEGPYKPNIEKLAREIGTTRDSLLRFINYSESAGLLKKVYHPDNGRPQGKPRMLYLNNSNFIYALSLGPVPVANLYETFLVNQLSYSHEVSVFDEATIVIDGEFRFHLAWKNNKTERRKSDADYSIEPNLESQDGTNIPIWMFGFLY